VISERHIVRELAVHALAFCIATGVAAIILYRNYGFLEAHTEDASEARDAFLTCIFVAGDIGPAVTLLVFWGLGMSRRACNRGPR
jgi:hypothetical protein